MRRYQDCPICLQPLVGRDWYEEPAGLVEACWVCQPCEVAKEFSYGASRWSLGRVEWIWGWSDEWDTVQALQEDFYTLASLLHSEYRVHQQGGMA